MSKAAKNLKKSGVEPKYQQSYNDVACKLVSEGYYNAGLAAHFRVTPTTISRWIKKYPDFGLAIERGKQLADEKVVNAVHKSAVGYKIPDEKVFCYQGEIIKAETEKYIAPSIDAAKFWLKNKRPDEWKDRQDVALGVGVLEVYGMDKIESTKVIDVEPQVVLDSDNQQDVGDFLGNQACENDL